MLVLVAPALLTTELMQNIPLSHCLNDSALLSKILDFVRHAHVEKACLTNLMFVDSLRHFRFRSFGRSVRGCRPAATAQ